MLDTNAHDPDQRIARDESDRALATNHSEDFQSPTLPDRSIARTRKRTSAPLGTVRRAALDVADARPTLTQLPSPTRSWSW